MSKKIPILMYHKISNKVSDKLTLSKTELFNQFVLLKKWGFTPIHFTDLQDTSGLPAKPILITFDDGYVNNYDFLPAIDALFKYKYTIFLPIGHIGKTNSWDKEKEDLMSEEKLESLQSQIDVVYGIHSYSHKNFKQISVDDIETELEQIEVYLKNSPVKFVKVMAYPFGGYSREETKQLEMFDLFETYSYLFAVRIGNRVNRIIDTVRNKFLLERLDIQGGCSKFRFRLKLIWGKPF